MKRRVCSFFLPSAGIPIEDKCSRKDVQGNLSLGEPITLRRTKAKALLTQAVLFLTILMT
jgi:hypothetical protein